MSASQLEQSRWNKKSMQTIIETTKKCPKCHTATEKAGISD